VGTQNSAPTTEQVGTLPSVGPVGSELRRYQRDHRLAVRLLVGVGHALRDGIGDL